MGRAGRDSRGKERSGKQRKTGRAGAITQEILRPVPCTKANKWLLSPVRNQNNCNQAPLERKTLEPGEGCSNPHG